MGTFLRFCNYAYSGTYHTEAVSRPGVLVRAFDQPYYGLKEFHCRRCNVTNMTNLFDADDHFPFCCTKHRNEALRGSSGPVYCAGCGNGLMHNTVYKFDMDKVCGKCEAALKSELLDADGIFSRVRTGPFRELKVCEDENQAATVRTQQKKVIRETNDNGACTAICDHARLHVFADMQMIPQMKQLSLSRLHGDLCDLEISEDSIANIIDLMVYTYDNTSKEDTKDTVPELSLRALVALYVTEHVELLMKYAAFRDTLNGGGEFVEDTIKGLVKK